MKLIFCIDNKNGMMFGGKRQSRDKILCENLLARIKGSKLWMSSYSAPLFSGEGEILIDDNYEAKAEENDYCFIEDKGYQIKDCKEIIIYKWNRLYPSDKMLDIDLKANGFKLISKRDFKGNSHEKITEEIYEREIVK